MRNGRSSKGVGRGFGFKHGGRFYAILERRAGAYREDGDFGAEDLVAEDRAGRFEDAIRGRVGPKD